MNARTIRKGSRRARFQHSSAELAGFALMGLLAGGQAIAQNQDAEDDVWTGVEELVVVGTAGAALLQDVSTSVISFDAEDLEAFGAQNIGDISQFTPNLEIRTVFAASNPTLFIRGVGLRDFNANSASSVAVYTDDVYMNSPAAQLAQLFDTEGIDVLRGPQGVLFGRNATAGTIRIHSRKPTGEVNGFTRFTYGRFEQIEVEGALEMPIVPDLLSLRVAGRRNVRDGITENRCGQPEYVDDPGENPRLSFRQQVHDACYNADTTATTGRGLGFVPGEPTGLERDVNEKDNWAARGIFRFQPNGDQDWFLNFHGSRNRGDSRQFQVIGVVDTGGGFVLGRPALPIYRDPDTLTPNSAFPPIPPVFAAKTPEDGNPFAGDYNKVGKEKLDLFGAILNGEIQSGDFTINTISGYEWNEREVATNLDGSPRISLEPTLDNNSFQVTEDVTVTWDAGNDFSLKSGFSFLYEELEVENDIDLGVTTSTLQEYEQETYYGAIFVHGTWSVSEVLEIQAGTRWNIESRDMNLTATLRSLTQGNLAPPQSAQDDFVEDAFTGEIKLHYRPTEDILIYGQYSRGWKSPHINGGVLTPNQSGSTNQSLLEPIDPEEVNAVEFGLKSQLFESAVTFNSAAFFYDYQNLQVFQFRNSAGGVPVNELINASNAIVYGVEIELTARPFEGWAPEMFDQFEVFASFAWLKSEYTDFVTTRVESSGITQVTTVEDFSDNQLINSPEFSFAGYVQAPIVLGRFGVFTPRLDWSFKDDVFFSPENNRAVGQDALWLLNLRLGYELPPDGAMVVSVWTRNLTNQKYRVDALNFSRFRNSILYAIGDQRTYGITTTVKF